MKTTRVRVVLREVAPVVMRVLDVPASVTLPELHDLFQVALGWTDSHLHLFVAGGVEYGVPESDGPESERDETGVRLAELPDRFVYLYDFGDNWHHDVEVLGRGGDRAGCVYGEGECPPEDCGGTPGYVHLREALSDPTHEDHDQMREWAGELAEFDQADTDVWVQRMVGEVPASVRLVLELTAGGVKLTPGRRLPRALVRRVQDQRPDWHWDGHGRAARLEEDLLPLAALHDVLRQAGLLRLRNGVLTPTRAAGDDLEVVRKLRGWFAPAGEFASLTAQTAIAVLAAGPPRRLAELAAPVFDWLGPGWVTSTGEALTERQVQLEISRRGSVLRGLDLIETNRGMWRAGPSARCLLPLATGLARYWSQTPQAAPEPPATAGHQQVSGRV